MRILIVSPIQRDAGTQNWGAPSLAVIRISSYIKTHMPGIELLFYDPQVDSFDPLKAYDKAKIDIVGISLLHYTLLETLGFINQWKKIHPESLIVVGGNEAGANYQDIFDKSPADIAVTAEGEKTLLDIIRWRLGEIKLEDINGIIYRKYAQPINDNALWDYWKVIDFSKYRYADYWKQIASLYDEPPYEKIKYVRLVTTSHCMRQCSFCSLAGVRNIACGQVVKPASLRGWQIMELVHNIHKQLPDVQTIYFVTDDVFYPYKQDFLEFMRLYRDSGYGYRILIQTSTYSIEEADFPKLKAINCQHITVGVENASERMRIAMRKSQDSKKIEQIIQWGNQYGIQIYYLIILIPPGSTLEDLWVNYSTIHRWIKNGVQVSIEPLIYNYRGSPIYESDEYVSSYERKLIPGTNQYLKDAIYVLPKDPIVKELALEFKARENDFVTQRYKGLKHKHRFKGETAPILIDLLGELLKKYDPQ